MGKKDDMWLLLVGLAGLWVSEFQSFIYFRVSVDRKWLQKASQFCAKAQGILILIR